MTEMDEFYEKRSRMERTYLTVDRFISDFESFSMIDKFLLEEGVFQELVGKMQFNRAFAKKINDGSVVLLMAAADRQEIESLIVMSETFSDG